MGFALVALGVLAARPAHSSWEQFRQAYDAGRYGAALEYLTTDPDFSASYYYNLANVHFRLGHTGRAVAYFLKADRIDPFDTDVRANLAVARKRLARTSGTADLDPASSALERLGDRVPDSLGLALASLLLVVAAWIWILRYRRLRSSPSSIRDSFCREGGWAGIALTALAAIALTADQVSDWAPAAAVLEAHAVRSGPGEHFLDLGRVTPGLKVRATSKAARRSISSKSSQGGGNVSKTWRQIRFGKEAVGWVPESILLFL